MDFQRNILGNQSLFYNKWTTVSALSEKTLLPIVQKYIKPASIVLSDCWKAYNNLQQECFQQNTVNHTYNFVDPYTGAHT